MTTTSDATSPTAPSDASPQAPAPEAGSRFEELAGAVDRARVAVDGLDQEPRAAAHELARAIEAFHRDALVAMVTTLKADPRGKELLFELVDEPSVRAALALHGIIRADPMTRAHQALERVRPYLQSHGGDVELVSIENGTAHVRLQGACNGCSMSAVTLQEGVSEALVEGVDEIDRVEVLDDQPSTVLIPVEAVGRRPATLGPGWTAGPAVSEIPSGTMQAVELDGQALLITHVEGRVGVFHNRCVHQGNPLDGGTLEGGVLTCPSHHFTYDAATGECLSSPGAQLEPLPARVDAGVVWVRTSHG